MKFLIEGSDKPYSLDILPKIANLDLSNNSDDREKAKETLGDTVEYNILYQLKVSKDKLFIAVHPNMILTEKGAYIIHIDYKDEPPVEMRDKKLLFLANGKLVKDYAENMNIKTPILRAIPLAPYYEQDCDAVRLEKFIFKFDLYSIDLRDLHLLKAVILGNFAVVETENYIKCISLKGKSRVQDLNGFNLFGKYDNKPLLTTSRNGTLFLFELSNTLTLVKLIKE